MAKSPSLAPRGQRLGAFGVNLLLSLSPFGSALGVIALGASSGMGGLAYLVWFAFLGALGCVAVMLTNLLLLARRRLSFGLACFGLVVDAAQPSRLVFAECAVVLFPPLAVVLPYLGNWFDREALVFVPFLLYAVDWLFWLGPSRRTLGDRLAGGRVVSRLVTAPESVKGFPRYRRFPDVALIALPLLPALLNLPWLGLVDCRGALAGGAAGSLLVLGLQLAVNKSRRGTLAQRVGLAG
jgi:hypothetical protein